MADVEQRTRREVHPRVHEIKLVTEVCERVSVESIRSSTVKHHPSLSRRVIDILLDSSA